MQSESTEFSEAAIFARVIRCESEDLSPALARHILQLGISQEDQRRVNELLANSQAGTLSAAEQDELENLNHVADLLSLWHSQARRALRRTN